MRREDFKYVSQNPGIYLIIDEVNNRYFVGRTAKLKKAIQTHFENCQSGRYSNVPLYDCMNADTLDNFSFQILCEIWSYPDKQWLDVILDKQLSLCKKAWNAEVIDLS